MTRTIVRICLLSAFVVGLLAGCSQVYVPRADGWCKEGREWVAPVKDAQGNWKDGYCREKQ